LTGKDGKFVIANAPAGSEIALMGWHEDVGWLLTKYGKKLTLQAGKNVVDIEMVK